ncbi:Outer dense fiber protein 3-like protein 2 [Tritrichomonas musculus]|uniref:Outer dense fiber protein 3-like protein 2 n=1 Tax=Tritrichomonas musculus TaxID=1915356 RepID=A0ABR2JSU1_9EUKA
MLFARCTGYRDSGPGPGAYETRTRNSGPQWTIKGRYSSSDRSIAAPYRSIPTTVGEGPKYSLHSRSGTREVQATPGPNYVPAPLGSDAKKTTMSYRHGEVKDSRIDNPGPGAYDIQSKFANDAPKSTLHSRTKTNDLGSSSPGPGAYMPNYQATKKRSPSASMHVRPSTAATEVTPGPSDYEVRRSLGGTSPSFHSRPRDSQAYVTPGPGAYSPTDSNMKSSPRYSMKGRHNSVERPLSAPYRSLPTTVGQGPKISLGSRHSVRSSVDTPGPSYIPPPLGTDSKKVSMSYRHGQARDSRIDNPGPGAYDIQPKFANDAPKSTLHSRTRLNDVGTSSPGPGAYMPKDDAIRRRAPSASMHVRTRIPGPEQTPGYYYNGSTLQGPRFTIGRREELELVVI